MSSRSEWTEYANLEAILGDGKSGVWQPISKNLEVMFYWSDPAGVIHVRARQEFPQADNPDGESGEKE